MINDYQVIDHVSLETFHDLLSFVIRIEKGLRGVEPRSLESESNVITVIL